MSIKNVLGSHIKVIIPLSVLVIGMGLLSVFILNNRPSADVIQDNNYISVCTVQDLQNIKNNFRGNYKQTCDIDLSSINDWEPIGSSTGNSFTGRYDGNSKSIKNLTIKNEIAGNKGLFGYNIGVIENVKLENISINAGFTSGGLVAHNGENGIIKKCLVSGNLTSSGMGGGLVGENIGVITDSSSTVKINGISGFIFGGLVGRNVNLVSNSFASGEVTAKYGLVGGLVGQLDTERSIVATINNSYYNGNVKSEDGQSVGGLVGTASGSFDARKVIFSEINNSYSAGSVGGNYSVGGLIGVVLDDVSVKESYSKSEVVGKGFDIGGLIGGMTSSSLEVSNSYSSGSVSGLRQVGGLIGNVRSGNKYNLRSPDEGTHVARITNSYSTGKVNSTESGTPHDIGGFIGHAYGEEIVKSFYNSETSGVQESATGTPKTTQEMKTQSTYTGWDFGNIWDLPINDYPKLRNTQAQPPTSTSPTPTPVVSTPTSSSVTTSTSSTVDPSPSPTSTSSNTTTTTTTAEENTQPQTASPVASSDTVVTTPTPTTIPVATENTLPQVTIVNPKSSVVNVTVKKNKTASFNFQAVATDADGISKVEFYNGNTLLGVGKKYKKSDNYRLNYSLGKGIWTVSAKAYDTKNNPAISTNKVSITVKQK